jgi:hypothetical protein
MEVTTFLSDSRYRYLRWGKELPYGWSAACDARDAGGTALSG